MNVRAVTFLRVMLIAVACAMIFIAVYMQHVLVVAVGDDEPAAPLVSALTGVIVALVPATLLIIAQLWVLLSEAVRGVVFSAKSAGRVRVMQWCGLAVAACGAAAYAITLRVDAGLPPSVALMFYVLVFSGLAFGLLMVVMRHLLMKAAGMAEELEGII